MVTKEYNIRSFQISDVEMIVAMFYETVHTVNKKDYTQDQLDAWAPKEEQKLKEQAWKESMSRNVAYIAEQSGVILGFGDMTTEGHLDRLFIHKDYQGQGIASCLVHALEQKAKELGCNLVDVDASITAKPFFERRGYQSIQEQTVVRKGIMLTNYKMIKDIN